MKLVDILARELTEWAGDVGAITQNQLTGELLDYYHCPLRGGNEREVSSIADDAGEAHDGASGAAVTRAEWQAAVEALNAPKVVEWDGVGLPPIGSVVDTDHKNKEIRVKILAYGAHHGGASCVLAADMSHGREGKMFGWMSDQCNFRPVLTPEQVAAEDREKAAKELYMTINWDSKPGTWENLLQARRDDYRKAIDAGYRKEPKPCGS